MSKKLVWFESFTTIEKHSAIITDEEAALFESDPEKFHDTVDYRYNEEIEWDKIKNEEVYDFGIEEE